MAESINLPPTEINLLMKEIAARKNMEVAERQRSLKKNSSFILFQLSPTRL